MKRTGNEYAWREALQVGDKAAIVGNGRAVVVVAEKVTKHHIVFADDGGRKWHRSKGRYVGAGTWSRVELQQATPQLLEKIAHLERAHRLAITLWPTEPFEVTAKICALLDGTLESQERPELNAVLDRVGAEIGLRTFVQWLSPKEGEDTSEHVEELRQNLTAALEKYSRRGTEDTT